MGLHGNSNLILEVPQPNDGVMHALVCHGQPVMHHYTQCDGKLRYTPEHYTEHKWAWGGGGG